MGLSCNVTIANVIKCMCNTHNVPIWASSILDSLFCNGWENETNEFVFTHHGKHDLVLIYLDMTSEMSIVKGNASLNYLLLAICTLCHQGCTHFLTLKKVSWVWHHEELTQGNIWVEKLMKDASNHKHKNNQPISILASCLVVVK